MSKLIGGSAELPGVGRVSFECVGNTAHVTGFSGSVIMQKGEKANFTAAAVIDDAMRVGFVVDRCSPEITARVHDIEVMIADVMSDPGNQNSLFFIVHDRARMDLKALDRRIQNNGSHLNRMLHEHRRGTNSNGEPTVITREMLDEENERVMRVTKPLLERRDHLKELAKDLSKWSHGDKTRTVAQILKAHERELSLSLPRLDEVSLLDAVLAASDGGSAVALPPISPFRVMQDVGIEGRNVFYVTDDRGHTINVERIDRLEKCDWQRQVSLGALQNGWPFEQESEFKRKVSDGDILLFDCTQPSGQALDRICSAAAKHDREVIVIGFSPEATYIGSSSAILAALDIPVAAQERLGPSL